MKLVQTSTAPKRPQGSRIGVYRTAFDKGIDPGSLGLSAGRAQNWPVVYILNNQTEAYVGQTTSVATRMSQHGANPEKQAFTTASVISCDEFNASVITDYEHRLIELMNADGRFALTNKNDGMTASNYFSKEEYGLMFEELWEELRHMELAFGSIKELEESEVFKYSPYKSLTPDQQVALMSIMDEIDGSFMVDAAGELRFVGNEPLVVEGMPGTGKTVLAVFLLKALKDNERFRGLNIKLLEPMTSLRETLRRSLKGVSNIEPDDIISAIDLDKARYGYRQGEKGCYDIVLVDEAHRLKRRQNLVSDKAYDDVNRVLGLPRDATELDWILDQVRLPIFFYDPLQSIKPTDVEPELFAERLGDALARPIRLDSQMRVKGGKEYLEYVRAVLSGGDPEPRAFEGYGFVLHESFASFSEAFEHDLEQDDLTRMLAGYAWKWVSKGKADRSVTDIEIEGARLRWNVRQENWVGLGISDPDVAREVGCIHAIQGYDLTHAYVIVGGDLRLDPVTGGLVAERSGYFDANGKNATDDTELARYVRNIYYVLLTRGIESTHVYVCDPALRAWMGKYFVERA